MNGRLVRGCQQTDGLRVRKAVNMHTGKGVCPDESDASRYDLTFVTCLPKLQQLTLTPQPLMLRPSAWRPKSFRLHIPREVPNVP